MVPVCSVMVNCATKNRCRREWSGSQSVGGSHSKRTECRPGGTVIVVSTRSDISEISRSCCQIDPRIRNGAGSEQPVRKTIERWYVRVRADGLMKMASLRGWLQRCKDSFPIGSKLWKPSSQRTLTDSISCCFSSSNFGPRSVRSRVAYGRKS